MRRILLASESPRRRELMNITGIPFSCAYARITEQLDSDLPIQEAVMKLAMEKAENVFASHENEFIVGADTIVLIDGEILGKPKDEDDAKRMLKMLSGKTHEVITGVAILSKTVRESFYERTKVTFIELSDEDIDTYIKSKEHHDKAGSYAIQGKGMLFVKKIDGDYSNVVGLPMSHLMQELKKYLEK